MLTEYFNVELTSTWK